MKIPSSNLFLGIIKEDHRLECTSKTIFCPCSTRSRRCLNCERIEQKECECPCECPLYVDVENFNHNKLAKSVAQVNVEHESSQSPIMNESYSVDATTNYDYLEKEFNILHTESSEATYPPCLNLMVSWNHFQ